MDPLSEAYGMHGRPMVRMHGGNAWSTKSLEFLGRTDFVAEATSSCKADFGCRHTAMGRFQIYKDINND